MLNRLSVTISRRRAVRRCGQQAVERLPVAVGIDPDVGPREPAAVQQAGVVLAVGEDDVAGPDQGGDRADVGGEARRETAARPRRLPSRPAAVPAGVASAACPVIRGLAPLPQPSAAGGLGHGRGQPRIGRQAQVVVGAEIDEFPAVEDQAGGLGRRPGGKWRRAGPVLQGREFLVDPSSGRFVVLSMSPCRILGHCQPHWGCSGGWFHV